MSFKCRDSLCPRVVYIPQSIESQVTESGEYLVKSVSSHKELRTADFRLSDMLKAGLPLDNVNTAVLGSSSIDLPFLEGSESDVEPSENDKTETTAKE